MCKIILIGVKLILEDDIKIAIQNEESISNKEYKDEIAELNEDNIEFRINDVSFFFTHGHRYNIDHIPYGIDVLVYGHLHTGFITEQDGVICVNSGSISLPKNGTKNSYLIIDGEKIWLKDVEGNVIDSKKYIK